MRCRSMREPSAVGPGSPRDQGDTIGALGRQSLRHGRDGGASGTSASTGASALLTTALGATAEW